VVEMVKGAQVNGSMINAQQETKGALEIVVDQA